MKTICQKCKDKICENSGTPCKKVEKFLRDNGVMSRDWSGKQISAHKRSLGNGYGKREIPFSAMGDEWRAKNLGENFGGDGV